MRYSINTVERQFSPKEAAEISGVSTTLQRDWRRRGVLPEKDGAKWATFTLTDVIEMTVMRAFSESGLSLETARNIAGMTVLPVLASLSRWDDTAVFEGHKLTAEQEELCRSGAVRGATEEDQFSFVALPEIAGGVSASRLKKLGDGEMVMARHKSFHAVVVDHYALAHHIGETALLPLITFKVELESEAD